MSGNTALIEPTLLRAGFWQRALALLIDVVIAMIPISLLAGIFFSLTDGRVYMASPVMNFSYCSSRPSYPASLNPPPPADSNVTTSCKIYTVTGMTANLLTVGRETHDGNLTTTLSHSYELNRQNEPISGFGIDLDWLGEVFALLLIIPMQSIYGRTIGQRALSTRISYLKDPIRTRIPVYNLLLRYALAYLIPLIGFIPSLVFYFSSSMPAIIASAILCGVPAVCWAIGNTVLIVQRKDPWFDRWSGLAEVKIASAKLISRPPPLPAMPPPLPHP